LVSVNNGGGFTTICGYTSGANKCKAC
jgi:hypothetical protein